MCLSLLFTLLAKAKLDNTRDNRDQVLIQQCSYKAFTWLHSELYNRDLLGKPVATIMALAILVKHACLFLCLQLFSLHFSAYDLYDRIEIGLVQLSKPFQGFLESCQATLSLLTPKWLLQKAKQENDLMQ